MDDGEARSVSPFELALVAVMERLVQQVEHNGPEQCAPPTTHCEGWYQYDKHIHRSSNWHHPSHYLLGGSTGRRDNSAGQGCYQTDGELFGIVCVGGWVGVVCVWYPNNIFIVPDETIP